MGKPLVALSTEGEQVLGVTNEQLAHCRLSAIVNIDFVDIMEG